MRKIFPKIYTKINKKYNRLLNLVFEIWIDSTFSAQGEMLKKVFQNLKIHYL